MKESLETTGCRTCVEKIMSRIYFMIRAVEGL